MPKLSRRKKTVYLLLIILVAMIGSFLFWREWRVRSIPDVGEPFDVAAFLNQYDPEQENAFEHYAKWIEVSEEISKENITQNVNYDIATELWERANEEAVNYVEQFRPSLIYWEEGSHLEQGYEIDPHDIRFESLLNTTQESREYTRLILLETSRLMHEGKREEVWDLYRQLLRVDGHIRNGCLISHLVGYAIYTKWYEQFVRFLAREDITVEELKQFHSDLRILHARFPRPVDALKFEYLGMRHSLDPKVDSHSWVNNLTGEREVYERVCNLLYAHWFKYYELPPWEAPPLVEHHCATSKIQNWIYPNFPDCAWYYFDDGPESDEVVAVFHSPSYTQRYLNEYMFALQQAYQATHRDQIRQRIAELQLALHIYYREHGHFPGQLDMLIPVYIDELPRKSDQAGEYLNYEFTETGVTISSPDQITRFHVYKPGAEIGSLFDLGK